LHPRACENARPAIDVETTTLADQACAAKRSHSMSAADLTDPRLWPDAATPAAAALHRSVQAALDARAERDAARHNAEATGVLRTWIAAGSPELVRTFATPPSPAVARHLRHLLQSIERGEPRRQDALRTTLVALPIVLIAALDTSRPPLTASGVIAEPRALEALLRDAGEFGGAEAFALSSTLAAVDAIEIAALPALLAHAAIDELNDGVPPRALDVAPAPIDVQAAGERVHLRFLLGAVLTAPKADPLHATSIANWGIPFAQAITKQLQAPGLSLLALPRPPNRLVQAAATGRAVQREVSAQLFASNAIRKFRASVGEPTAVISAHRCPDAPGGGEVRLSLSSPFAMREAEGLRCPVYPYESVQNVASMLVALLRDCRITNIQVRAGIHADIDPTTGGPLLFKGQEAAPCASLH
jgi:hypothetical protein